jgi:hypothetical protein
VLLLLLWVLLLLAAAGLLPSLSSLAASKRADAEYQHRC